MGTVAFLSAATLAIAIAILVFRATTHSRRPSRMDRVGRPSLSAGLGGEDADASGSILSTFVALSAFGQADGCTSAEDGDCASTCVKQPSAHDAQASNSPVAPTRGTGSMHDGGGAPAQEGGTSDSSSSSQDWGNSSPSDGGGSPSYEGGGSSSSYDSGGSSSYDSSGSSY